MIEIYGTSHVSQDSLDVVDEAFEEEPDIVALELDPIRLQALLTEGDRESGDMFISLIQKFQDYIGSKTGLMPGQEMLYAYERAVEKDLDIALVDQDVKITVQKLKEVRRKEKVKAALSIIGGLLLPFGNKFDISEIPEEEKLFELIEQFEDSFPELYNILMSERNQVMKEALMQLQNENPSADIAVFVGAAHKKPIKDMLRKEGYAVGSQSSLEEFE